MWTLTGLLSRREVSLKPKLSIYWSIYVIYTDTDDRLWLVTERIRSWTQVPKTGFLLRVYVLTLTDRVMISAGRD